MAQRRLRHLRINPKIDHMEMVYYTLPKAPFLNPEQVVDELALEPGMKVLDFGAGAGFWSIPLAQKVGAAGHVYVTDPKVANLSLVKSKATKLGLENMSFFKAPYSGEEMPIQTKLDLILVANVLSFGGDREKILLWAKKLAKGGTRLVIVDWSDKSKIGPKEDLVDVEALLLSAAKKGFVFKKLLSAGSHHTGMYFIYEK